MVYSTKNIYKQPHRVQATPISKYTDSRSQVIALISQMAHSVFTQHDTIHFSDSLHKSKKGTFTVLKAPYC